MGLTNQPPDLLPGTLDLLILRTLVAGTLHGYGIAERLKVLSQDVLQVGESSLYPALQRLLLNGWVKAEWGVSENQRRARYYELTARGRKHLTAEAGRWRAMTAAIGRVLGPALAEG
jgi:PadR family transcriptional regulator PadR